MVEIYFDTNCKPIHTVADRFPDVKETIEVIISVSDHFEGVLTMVEIGS